MTAPLRGTQSLVGQMGWVTSRPLLIAIEVGWRWIFGVPFLAICWIQGMAVLSVLTPEVAGLNRIDTQNPWVAAVQLQHSLSLYLPHVLLEARRVLPIAALGWIVVSGIGRSFVLRRIDPTMGSRVAFRPGAMMVLQAAWLALLGATWWCWLRSMASVTASHITSGAEPNLVGYAGWTVFLSLGFFTLWALVNWTLSITPLVMLLEDRSVLSALSQSLRLGREFTGKLVEINLVMGIVNLALIVLAMVLSAAPLPFSDELGPETLHAITALAVVFYLVASDYFQVVRLKGFVEFWKLYRAPQFGIEHS